MYILTEITHEKLTVNEPVIHSVLSWHMEVNVNRRRPLLYGTDLGGFVVVFLLFVVFCFKWD